MEFKDALIGTLNNPGSAKTAISDGIGTNLPLAKVSDVTTNTFIPTDVDEGAVRTLISDAPVSIILPRNKPPGFGFTVIQGGQGQLAYVAENGATALNPDTFTATRAYLSSTSALVLRNSTGFNAEWYVQGDLTIPNVSSVLTDLSLGKTTFAIDAVPGTVIGAILGRTSGSILTVSPNDGRFSIDSAGNLLVGLSASSLGAINVTIRETLAGASNSPKSTTLQVTCTVPAETTVVRGMGQGMHANVIGFESGSAWSRITRTGHVSKRAFSRSRVKIPTWMLTAPVLAVQSLTSSGTTCTAVVPSTSSLLEGQFVIITGAGLSTYNGTFAIHIVDGTTFTYVATTSPATTPATGTIVATSQSLNEVDLPYRYRFQVALEATFLDALTGLPVGLPYLFGGSKTALYNGPGTNPDGYILSDWLNHPIVSADSKFGFRTVVENQQGGTSPVDTLPAMWNLSSAINRFEGHRTNASDGATPGVSFIDLDSVVSGTTVLAFPTSVTGSRGGFWPCSMDMDYPISDTVPAILGDGTADGMGEGTTGSLTFGDVMGNAVRDRGYMERAVHTKLGKNFTVNLSKSGDGYKFLGLPGNFTKRLKLLASTNPTHVWLGHGHDDVSALRTLEAFTADFVSAITQIKNAMPDVKLIHSLIMPDASSARVLNALTFNGTTVTGTMASTADLTENQMVTISGATPTVYNGDFQVHIVDGTTITYTVGSVPSGAASGNLRLNNQFTSVAGQSLATGWGNSASRRGQINALLRGRAAPFVWIDDIFDPNTVAEQGYTGTAASETGLWKVSSTPWTLTGDGSRPNSRGADTIAAAVSSNLFTPKVEVTWPTGSRTRKLLITDTANSSLICSADTANSGFIGVQLLRGEVLSDNSLGGAAQMLRPGRVYDIVDAIMGVKNAVATSGTYTSYPIVASDLNLPNFSGFYPVNSAPTAVFSTANGSYQDYNCRANAEGKFTLTLLSKTTSCNSVLLLDAGTGTQIAEITDLLVSTTTDQRMRQYTFTHPNASVGSFNLRIQNNDATAGRRVHIVGVNTLTLSKPADPSPVIDPQALFYDFNVALISDRAYATSTRNQDYVLGEFTSGLLGGGINGGETAVHQLLTDDGRTWALNIPSSANGFIVRGKSKIDWGTAPQPGGTAFINRQFGVVADGISYDSISVDSDNTIISSFFAGVTNHAPAFTNVLSPLPLTDVSLNGDYALANNPSIIIHQNPTSRQTVKTTATSPTLPGYVRSYIKSEGDSFRRDIFEAVNPGNKRVLLDNYTIQREYKRVDPTYP